MTGSGTAKKRKPTLEEIIAHGATIGLDAEECERFYYYHESRGWVVGRIRAPMQSWKGAMQTWKRAPWRQAGQPMGQGGKDAVRRGTARHEADRGGGVVEELE